jgi:ADP-ribose pyrophosphatase YjhB (NUDIX family)
MAPPPSSGRRRLRTVNELSAGGLVVDRAAQRPQAALIARHDRRGRLVWSLPKGHVEEGESVEEAAVREVEEETGIRGRLLAPLGAIDFWFVADDRRVHKTVHHFLLEAEDGALSDADIEVVEVAWVPLEDVAARLGYSDERRLAERAVELLDSA